MRIYWNDNPYIDSTFYRVYKTEGKKYYDSQEILADFTKESEANAFADEQNKSGIDCDVVAVLGYDDYMDLHPSRPCEL